VIGIADPDLVNLTNLQRQLVHATGRVGAFRVECARAAHVDATALDLLFAVKVHADSIVTFSLSAALLQEWIEARSRIMTCSCLVLQV